MTSRTRSRIVVVAIVGVLAGTVSSAHAGGGMGAGIGNTVCRLVQNAVSQPQRLAISDQSTVTPDQVSLGAAVLLCDLPAGAVNLTVDTFPTDPPPWTPTPPPGPANIISCYALAGADPAKLTATFKDAFGTQTVRVGAIQLFCVPALLE